MDPQEPATESVQEFSLYISEEKVIFAIIIVFFILLLGSVFFLATKSHGSSPQLVTPTPGADLKFNDNNTSSQQSVQGASTQNTPKSSRSIPSLSPIQSPTPIPLLTPTPTPSPTPLSTSTPTPIPTVTPTPITPTPTPTPTLTPTPTPTPEITP